MHPPRFLFALLVFAYSTLAFEPLFFPSAHFNALEPRRGGHGGGGGGAHSSGGDSSGSSGSGGGAVTNGDSGSTGTDGTTGSDSGSSSSSGGITSTNSGSGPLDCVTEFGAGWAPCFGLCYNKGAGEVCCAGNCKIFTILCKHRIRFLRAATLRG